jgi:hypothetical protein
VEQRILTQENIDYVLDRVITGARQIERTRTAVDDVQAGIADIERQLENLVRLAAETGDVSLVADEVKRLKATRSHLAATTALASSPFDYAAIRETAPAD